MGVAPGQPVGLVDHYIAALAFFGEQVAAVPGTAWDDTAAVGEWTLRAVVAHVVVGESEVTAQLRAGHGAGSAAALVDSGILGANPLAAWRGTALAAIAAARAASDSPELTEVLGRRITENLVHGWDVAQTSARAVTIPADAAEWSLDFWLPRRHELGATAGFGPLLSPPPGAGPGERLLALTGRASGRS